MSWPHQKIECILPKLHTHTPLLPTSTVHSPPANNNVILCQSLNSSPAGLESNPVFPMKKYRIQQTWFCFVVGFFGLFGWFFLLFHWDWCMKLLKSHLDSTGLSYFHVGSPPPPPALCPEELFQIYFQVFRDIWPKFRYSYLKKENYMYSCK